MHKCLQRVSPDAETIKSDAMRRFTLTGAKSQELDRLVTQHKQVTAEVEALQKQLLDLRKENDNLRGEQDELVRQADVLRHKADELDVERGRLSGELTQALRRVQAAEDGNVRCSCAQHQSGAIVFPHAQQAAQQELQAAQQELAKLRAGGNAVCREHPECSSGTCRHLAHLHRAIRGCRGMWRLPAGPSRSWACWRRTPHHSRSPSPRPMPVRVDGWRRCTHAAAPMAGLQRELQVVASGGRVQAAQAVGVHDARQDGVMDINKDHAS